MYPTLYEIQGGMGIHSYGLLIAAAFVAAFVVVYRRSMQVGIHPDRLVGIFLASGLGGAVGARVLYLIAVEPMDRWLQPSAIFSGAGFAYYGGVIGGALAVSAVARAQGTPYWKLADIAGPALVLGYGVGRFGCFFAGCCHGAEAPLGPDPLGLLPSSFSNGQIWLSSHFPFLTLEFHTGVGRLHDVPLYPTQIWSAFSGLFTFALLSWVWSRRRFDGQVAALTLLMEPAFRILIESFRADQRGYAFSWPAPEFVAGYLPGLGQAGEELGQNLIGLTTSQAIGLGMMVLGVVLYQVLRGQGVAPEKRLQPEEDLNDLLA